MLDLETVGVTPGSGILSISAVEFNTVSGKLGSEFEAFISMSDLRAKGFYFDPKVIAWWENLSDAQNITFKRSSVSELSVIGACELFRDWMQPFKAKDGIRLWGNGAAFDNVLLQTMYNRVQLPTPWHYTQDRCFRTLKPIGKALGIPVPLFEGLPHYGLDDARHQARHATAILQRIYANG